VWNTKCAGGTRGRGGVTKPAPGAGTPLRGGVSGQKILIGDNNNRSVTIFLKAIGLFIYLKHQPSKLYEKQSFLLDVQHLLPLKNTR
jgi:hypothetical protein